MTGPEHYLEAEATRRRGGLVMAAGTWGYEVSGLTPERGPRGCSGQTCARPASLVVRYVVRRGVRLQLVAERLMCGHCGPTVTRLYDRPPAELSLLEVG